MESTVVAGAAFLTALYRGWSARQGGLLTLWRGDTKRSTWIAAGEPAKVDEAVERALKTRGADLYFGLGLRRAKTAGRGEAADVVAIPGVWIDLDFAEWAHRKDSKKKYPPQAVAERVLAEMPLPPSVVVASGGGLHAYWLTDELIDVEADRPRAERLVSGWEALVAEKLARAGGYVLDSVHDLARVLRVPGSWNYRHGRAVEVVGPPEADWARYDIADLEQFIEGRAVESPRVEAVKYEVGELLRDPAANPPTEKMDALRFNSPEFTRTWEHKRNFPSNSDYEISLAHYAIQALWSDQEIADLLIAHRRKYEPEKLSKLTERLDYLARTIGKARGDKNHDAAVRALNGDAEALDHMPEQPAERAEATPDQRQVDLDRLSAVFGVKIEKWIQIGKDRPLYLLRLVGGTEIKIGGTAAVLDNCKAFERAIYAETGIVMQPLKKGAWRGVCEALARICETIDSEDMRDAAAMEWSVEQYLKINDMFDATRRDEACQRSATFVEDGWIHVCIEPLRRWINTHGGDRLSKSDFFQALRAIGFSQITVHHLTEHGMRTTKSYWYVKADAFESTLVVNHA